MIFHMLDAHGNVKSRRNFISINRMFSLAIQFFVNALAVCDRHQYLMILFVETNFSLFEHKIIIFIFYYDD